MRASRLGIFLLLFCILLLHLLIIKSCSIIFILFFYKIVSSKFLPSAAHAFRLLHQAPSAVRQSASHQPETSHSPRPNPDPSSPSRTPTSGLPPITAKPSVRPLTAAFFPLRPPPCDPSPATEIPDLSFPVRSSSLSMNQIKECVDAGAILEKARITHGPNKPTKCRLALNLDSKIVIVARGMVHPASRPVDQCHNQQILPDHVKVGIDAVEPIHEGTPLSVSTKHHITIGEAFGSFVQWSKSLVLLGDNDTATPFVSKDKAEEFVAKAMNKNEMVINSMANEPAKRNTIVSEVIFKTLSDRCRYFHDLVVQVPSYDDAINAIQVNKDLFTYDEVFEIHTTVDDIIQFLSMARLNESWMQIYSMWLNHV